MEGASKVQEIRAELHNCASILIAFCNAKECCAPGNATRASAHWKRLNGQTRYSNDRNSWVLIPDPFSSRWVSSQQKRIASIQ